MEAIDKKPIDVNNSTDVPAGNIERKFVTFPMNAEIASQMKMKAIAKGLKVPEVWEEAARLYLANPD